MTISGQWQRAPLPSYIRLTLPGVGGDTAPAEDNPSNSVCSLPSLFCAQADGGHLGCSRGCGLRILGFRGLLGLRLLHRNVYHTEDAGLHIEALDDFGVGILEGDNGDLAHLIATASDLRESRRGREGAWDIRHASRTATTSDDPGYGEA